MKFFTSGAVSALVIGLATAAIASSSSASAASMPYRSAAESAYADLRQSVRPTSDEITGHFVSPRMSIEIVMMPRNEAGLSALLEATYDPRSPRYHDWLRKGEFDALFAPESTQVESVDRFLTSGGLALQRASSPFLIRAIGSSTEIESVFKTRIATYRDVSGRAYYANVEPIRLPIAIAKGIDGVIGLTDTTHVNAQYKLPWVQPPAHHGLSPDTSCEYPYPTAKQIFLRGSKNTPYPFGYGAGPSCMGLTMPQINGLYGAPVGGTNEQGHGINIAVFELAAYTESDITTWYQYYFGSSATPPLTDVLVDGGPLNPQCPSGDTCYPGYNSDIEVDADIETALALAPSANMIYVYNAPNDNTGQTLLDEYGQIANDDVADVVSTSWGQCEDVNTVGYEQAENTIFEQMATQGQSILAAAGDTGAYECDRSGGSTTTVDALDPAAQPWVTGVGGTSFGSDNPRANAHPVYPKAGVETVWNVDDLCSTIAQEGPAPGWYWCEATGAGGGAPSQFWGMPSWQSGPGVISSYTTYGNGTTQCSFAAMGTACRETPDISGDADEYTGYAEYCTGTDPSSTCNYWTTFSPSPGWYEIGGTSLATPLWAGIIADRDSYIGARTGNVAEFAYPLFDTHAAKYFHDITGVGQTTDQNGYFPVTPGYDMATGIGTPKMTPLITETP